MEQAASYPNWLDQEPESRIVLHDVSWDLYEGLLESRGEKRPSIRFAYLDGDLEIMSTSRTHEQLKKNFARLLELYSLEKDVPLAGLGQATFREKARRHGLEPDECYFISGVISHTEPPDLAIEVVLRRLELDKLAIYARLQVKEVWLIHRDHIEVNSLRGSSYRRVKTSRLLPHLDLMTLLRYAYRLDQMQAVRDYRAHLRALR